MVVHLAEILGASPTQPLGVWPSTVEHYGTATGLFLCRSSKVVYNNVAATRGHAADDSSMRMQVSYTVRNSLPVVVL